MTGILRYPPSRLRLESYPLPWKSFVLQAVLRAADKALKQEVADIYEQLEMDLPTAFHMFMTRSKMVKGLPFEATLPADTITRTDAINAFWKARNQASDVQEMSLDEINAEISAARAERKK